MPLKIKAAPASVKAEAAKAVTVMPPVAENGGLSIEKTLKEIARIAYFDPRNLYGPDGVRLSVDQLDEDTAAAISHMSANGPVPHDKNVALEKAMKFHGLYELDNAQSHKPVRIKMIFE